MASEDCRTAGPTAEIACRIEEACFDYLDAPIARIGAKDAFIAHNVGMYEYVLPGPRDIESVVIALVD